MRKNLTLGPASEILQRSFFSSALERILLGSDLMRIGKASAGIGKGAPRGSTSGSGPDSRNHCETGTALFFCNHAHTFGSNCAAKHPAHLQTPSRPAQRWPTGVALLRRVSKRALLRLCGLRCGLRRDVTGVRALLACVGWDIPITIFARAFI